MKVEGYDEDETAVVSNLEGRPEVTLILMNEGDREELVSYVSLFVNGEYILEVEVPKGAGDLCWRVGENRVLEDEEADELGVPRGSLATNWDDGDRLLTSGEYSGFPVATPAMKKRNPAWTETAPFE